MSRTLPRLPRHDDRPPATILDGLHTIDFRTVPEIARRIGVDVYHVADELRKMFAAGDVEHNLWRPSPSFSVPTFRLSSLHRVAEVDQARGVDDQARKGPRRRVDPAHAAGRRPFLPAILKSIDVGDPLDPKVSDFRHFGLEGGES